MSTARVIAKGMTGGGVAWQVRQERGVVVIASSTSDEIFLSMTGSDALAVSDALRAAYAEATRAE